MGKKSGFTLAEILITLTLIGMVAATSIPSLVTSINEDHYKVAAKKVYAEMSGVVKQMVKDKGTLDGYINNPNSFKPDFIKYFNVVKDCGLADCVPNSINSDIYKSLTGEGADAQIGGEGQFVTADGMLINIQNGAASYSIMITVDVNGHIKPPNIYGKDTFIFQIINDNLLPMGTFGTHYTAITFCNKSVASPYQGYGCAVNVMTDTKY